MSAPLELEPYQQDCRDWLAGVSRRCLAGDPGIGKTPIGVAVCDKLNAQRVFVLCPAIALEVWRRHFLAWSKLGLPIVIVRTASDLRRGPGVFILSYSLAALRKDIGMMVRGGETFDVMLLDEAHALKNSQSARTEQVYGVGAKGGADSYVANARHVYALTGSPTPNHAGELYPHLRALAPELIRANTGQPMDEHTFLQRYTVGAHAPDGWRVYGNKNPIELRARIRPFIKRVTKKQAFGGRGYVEPLVATYPLPDSVLPKDFRSAEAPILDTLLGLKIKGVISDDEFLLAVRKNQMGEFAKFRHEVGLAKIEGVAQLVENDLAARHDEKIVVFAWHLDVIDGIANRLSSRGVKVEVIGGSTPQSERTKYIDAFQTRPEPRVMVIQMAAGGHVITLTRSHNVIIVEPDPVPENNRQPISRCDRFGQTERVLARLISIPGTIDDRIAEICARKIRDISFLIDGQQTATAATQGAAFPPLPVGALEP
jgi:SWI/SNF-related matrix-associated actin-dependent regulator of chromatin subfamily A-like protein 1